MSKLIKTKFFRDPQNIIAVGVTAISLCALIVSLIQTNVLKEEHELMRVHARASVWPHVVLGSTLEHNLKDNSISYLSFTLTNKGVGPAIITDVKISYNNKIVHNWWELFSIQGIPDSIDNRIDNGNFNDIVLQNGETIEILNMNANLTLANEFYERLEGFSLEIYYESIYGEKWKFDGTTTKLENFNGLPEEEQFR